MIFRPSHKRSIIKRLPSRNLTVLGSCMRHPGGIMPQEENWHAAAIVLVLQAAPASYRGTPVESTCLRTRHRHRPITWLLNRFVTEGESSREFIGETGRAGLTALNTPAMSDRSATEVPIGSDGSIADRRDRYSEKAG
jgi:hypothetical protein